MNEPIDRTAGRAEMAEASVPTVAVHGARGSLPASGASMARYGGETCCVELRGGGGSIFLDAGSGIGAASAARMAAGDTVLDVFLTHLHFDHICGLSFVAQLGDPGGRVRVWTSERAGRCTGIDPGSEVTGPFRPPNFPIALGDMPGSLEFHAVPEGEAVRVNAMTVTAEALNHPGGSSGYRVEIAGRSFAYVTDHEPGGPADDHALRLLRGADLALLDTTYTPEEADRHKGWGHGDWRACGRLAERAGARRWGLFHHHYLRDDAALDREGERAAREFAGAFVAAAGMRLTL